MTPEVVPSTRARLGRPRAFDRDEMLMRVAELFDRHGYEGLSVADLAIELGVSHPSLYAAFGAKPVLYRMALDAYAARWVAEARLALSADRVDEALRAFFALQVQAFRPDERKLGCMLSAALQTSAADHAMEARHATALRALMIRTVRERLDRAVFARELPPKADTRALATCVCGIVHGMSTLARDGASRETLSDVADFGLSGLRARMALPTPARDLRAA